MVETVHIDGGPALADQFTEQPPTATGQGETQRTVAKVQPQVGDSISAEQEALFPGSQLLVLT